jgi:hypothetical protein
MITTINTSKLKRNESDFWLKICMDDIRHGEEKMKDLAQN